MSKVFGLYGKSWGIIDIEWEHITIPKTKTTQAGTEVQNTIIAKGVFTFLLEGVKTKITNSDKLSYYTKDNKELIDVDVYKKIETNTIAKFASRFGFGTDIYLGEFEDINYTNEVLGETQLCNAETLGVLRNELQKNDVSADIVTKHFSIRMLKDLMYKDFEEAIALIRSNKK